MPAKILIVDDEAMVAESLRVLLGQLGYAVVGTAGTAEAALAAVAHVRPDLVLLDINLGHAHAGIGAAETIRTRHALPVVYVTAHADDATFAGAKITHPFGCVTRPFESHHLQVAIEIALHHHGLEQQLQDSQRALGERERWQRAVLDTVGDPIWLKNREGRYLAINRAWCKYFAREERQVIGKTDEEVFPAALARGFRAEDQAVLASGQHLHMEEQVPDRHHANVWFETDKAPLRNEQREIVGVVGIARDITARKQADEELRRISRWLFASQRISATGGWAIDLKTSTVWVSPEARRIYGYSDAPVTLAEVQSLALPACRPALDRALKELIDKGTPYDLEFQVVRRSDGVIVDVHSVAEYDASEGLVLGVVQDITERKRAEMALAKDEAELAAVYDHAPIMMLLIDGQRKVRRINQAAQEFTAKGPHPELGQSAGELLGCLHALDDPRGCGFGPECTSCPLRRVTLDTLQNGTTHRRIETWPRYVRGNEVVNVTLLASTARVIVADEALVLLCLEDVSQQRQAEQRVREQAALLDVTRDAIVVVGLDDRVSYWNRGAEDLYGRPASEAVGQSWVRLVFDAPPAPEFTVAWQAICQEGEWSGELRQRTRDGSSLVTLCRGVLMHDLAGSPRSVLFTASNITESKRLEAQFLRAQRLDSLGSLAGGVAHDLNNVFTPIMMSIEMLRAVTSDARDREILQLLDESTRRGADIVRQLLLFSRGSDTPRGEVSATVLLRELRRMMQETFPKNIEISVQAPADLWPVQADQTQLHQVLLNLCVNARDAMPEGGQLTICAENVQVDEDFAAAQLKARSGPHVFMRVVDNGSGIQPELIEKIFDPFFTTKTLGQGTGLGLAAALGIVRSHGGFITVKSRLGQGSEFGVYLPALIAVGAAAGGVANAPARRGRGELVLVVDDEVNIQILLEMALTRNGYTVARASDGAEAVSVVGERGVEVRLVVTDMMMPKTDGISSVRALRKMRPQLPILAISGVPGHRVELDKFPPPKIQFIAKPFNIDRLLNAVRDAIDGSPSAS